MINNIQLPMPGDKALSYIIQGNPYDWTEIKAVQGEFRFKSFTNFICNKDVNLRIEQIGEEQPFNDDWAKIFDYKPDQYFYGIYYGSSQIGTVILVSVDGDRARVPIPDALTNEVDFLDYKVATIIDAERVKISGGTPNLENYMRRLKLSYNDPSKPSYAEIRRRDLLQEEANKRNQEAWASYDPLGDM